MTASITAYKFTSKIKELAGQAFCRKGCGHFRGSQTPYLVEGGQTADQSRVLPSAHPPLPGLCQDKKTKYNNDAEM